MKKYKVTACYYTYCTAVVEAESAERAAEIAADMDGGDFKQSGELSDWHINSVTELVPTLKPVHKPFAAAYYEFVNRARGEEGTKQMLAEYFEFMFNNQPPEKFVNKYGYPAYTSISDHWDMWRNHNDYEKSHA